MKKKISIIILCVFCLFFKLFSQNTDTIKISLKLPYSVYFDSPCFTIIDCFDTIYQSVDTLFLVFPDIRRFDSRGEFRPSLEDTSIFPITKDDSAKRYGYYVENVYHINKHIIKRFNIKLSIPPYYANYTVLGIRFPYRDEICFFKQERKYKYKYLGKKNLSENKWYKKDNKDSFPRWMFKDWASPKMQKNIMMNITINEKQHKIESNCN